MKTPKTWPLWFGVFAGLAAISLSIASTPTLDVGLLKATYWTGRIAFPIFIITFMASSLATLFPNPWTKALLRKRRWWGLGFAASFGIHIAIMLVYKQNIEELGAENILYNKGFILSILLAAMVFTSNNTAQRVMGPRWKWLHSTGMWLWLIKFTITGIPYALIALVAAGLRIISWIENKRRHRLANERYR